MKIHLMHNKSTPSSIKPNTMIKKRTKKKARRAKTKRSKTKKPKFLSLSLSLQLSPEKTQQQPTEMPSSATNHRQLNLFPLHPQNSTEDKDTHDDHNMAYFFSSADGGATTLTSLLGSSTTSSSHNDNNTTNNNDINNSTTLSTSVSYAYGAQDSEEGGALVRTALRNKERDVSEEERWVCYSEVVERRLDEEVTSCAAAAADDDDRRKLQRLSLKLDYQEILNVWSDRSPLYIHVETPQIVPDIYVDLLPHETSNALRDGCGSNTGLLRVPELRINESDGGIRSKQEAVQVDEKWKLGQREASVLRYKEKRHNRLFATRIRYEVRKLNAEKRHRVKGRFAKRS